MRALPPDEGNEGADAVGEHIQRIAGGVLQDARAHPFEEHGPEGQVPEDFPARRRSSARTQAEPFMRQQQRWQRAREEQRVVEPAGEEIDMDMRLHPPAVHRVKRAADEDERIAQGTE